MGQTIAGRLSLGPEDGWKEVSGRSTLCRLIMGITHMTSLHSSQEFLRQQIAGGVAQVNKLQSTDRDGIYPVAPGCFEALAAFPVRTFRAKLILK